MLMEHITTFSKSVRLISNKRSLHAPMLYQVFIYFCLHRYSLIARVQSARKVSRKHGLFRKRPTQFFSIVLHIRNAFSIVFKE